jgi:chorismate-pyruvate lyase
MTDSLTWLRDPATESAELAASVVTRLARGTGPATALFEELAGEPVRIDLTGNAYRLLTPAECLDLGISPGAYGYQRNGTLRTVNSALVAAEVSSVVVPDRLPPAARRALSMSGPDDLAPAPSAIPLGTVLADLGVRREPLGARLTCGITSASGRRTLVESWARMWLGDTPVALASERVTTEFCQRTIAAS